MSGTGKLDSVIHELKSIALYLKGIHAMAEAISNEASDEEDGLQASEDGDFVQEDGDEDEVPSSRQPMEIRETDGDEEKSDATRTQVRGESGHFQQPTDVGGGFYTRSQLVSKPKSGRDQPATLGTPRDDS